jgi:peptidoglycan/xylan/chitin deacetylase (PgdA/CDA1 family)
MLLEIYRLLLPLPHREREKAMSQVRGWQRERSVPEPNRRCLSPDEIVRLDLEGLIEIGAHSVTHPVLPTLPARKQRTEVESSKSCLETLLGKPVRGFSFPNGAWSEESVNLVKASGYHYACTSRNDVAWSKTDRFLLPRFWIPDWDGDRFLRWLRWWRSS